MAWRMHLILNNTLHPHPHPHPHLCRHPSATTDTGTSIVVCGCKCSGCTSQYHGHCRSQCK
jgi:hypothetical protein